MTASTPKVPTILATSGGLTRGRRTLFGFGPLLHYAIELSGVQGRAPRVCYVGTAAGDQDWFAAQFTEAGQAAGVDVSLLKLFMMPNVDDLAGLALDQDVVWVGGGSVANLLALWRLHRLDEVFRQAWAAGVVLAGVSAGSICWHVGGTTDSFGPDLRPVTNGLGFLPYANGVHYDHEEQRRPRFHQFIAEGILPAGYATDDGVGLVYRGTELAEAVAEIPGKAAYHVALEDGEVREERLDTRLLPGA
jgi:peptidase E